MMRDNVSGKSVVSRDVTAFRPTVFHEDWWLDVVTNGNWAAARHYRGGTLVGWMPYVVRRRLWFKESRMPLLTHFLGPVVESGSGGEDRRFSNRTSITRALIEQLPQTACFAQKMHRDMLDIVAFQIEGYTASVQFTFELELKPPDIVWRGLRDKTRNVIRRADEEFKVRRDLGAAEFLALYESNLALQKRVPLYDSRRLASLLNECLTRGQGQAFSAESHDGKIMASIFCVWDKSVSYYFLSTRHPDSGNGVIALLLWTAIQHAIENGLLFDFDGLAHPGSVSFYSGFGAKVSARYIVSKTTLPFRLLREGRRLLGQPDNLFTDSI